LKSSEEIACIELRASYSQVTKKGVEKRPREYGSERAQGFGCVFRGMGRVWFVFFISELVSAPGFATVPRC
jgi:hypothetical protein